MMGWNDAADALAIGVWNRSAFGAGVKGETNDGTGVLGISRGGPSPVAVRGIRRGTYGLAGQFDGNVQANGDLRVNDTLSKSLGTFVIDYPLDPANKYHRHSFVK